LRRQKPFSFAERDAKREAEKAERLARRNPVQHHFRAKKVPWNVKVSLYQQMKTSSEEKRKARIEKRSKVLKKEYGIKASP
jgi:7-cyano-7-deazaguanine synthase in queuosine biosynthesis